MDTLERYREIVRALIVEYAQYKPAHGQIETEAIVDHEKDHYGSGQRGARPGCLPKDHKNSTHFSIGSLYRHYRGQKVWVQYDGTSRLVAEELIAAGIPWEAIVLGFHPAEVRLNTLTSRLGNTSLASHLQLAVFP